MDPRLTLAVRDAIYLLKKKYLAVIDSLELHEFTFPLHAPLLHDAVNTSSQYMAPLPLQDEAPW